MSTWRKLANTFRGSERPSGQGEASKPHDDKKSPREISREVSLKSLEGIFKTVTDSCDEEKSRIRLDPSSLYDNMVITIIDLELDENGSYLHRYDPCFFDPLRRGIYPPSTQDADTQRNIRNIKETWGGWQSKADMGDAHDICTVVGRYFESLKRVIPEQRESSLRQLSRWIPGGLNLDWDLDKKAFYTPLNWTPRCVYRCPLNTGPLPHMLVNLVHGFPDSENLYYSELVTITAAMIMQLRDPSFSHDTTMPVMVFSFTGQRKGRILQAYESKEGLVIRKSKLFDFSTWEEAEKSINLFVQFMASDPVGDTKALDHPRQRTGHLTERKPAGEPRPSDKSAQTHTDPIKEKKPQAA